MSDSPVSRSDSKFYHTTVLVIACLIPVFAILLHVQDDQGVAMRWAMDQSFPQICALRGWFGIDCPACGLTRSFIHIAQGALGESIQQHRLGWLMALAVLIQVPYRIAALHTGRDAPWGQRLPQVFIYSLLILLMANWLIGLLWVGH